MAGRPNIVVQVASTGLQTYQLLGQVATVLTLKLQISHACQKTVVEILL